MKTRVVFYAVGALVCLVGVLWAPATADCYNCEECEHAEYADGSEGDFHVGMQLWVNGNLSLPSGKGYFYKGLYLENGMDVGSGNVVIGSGNLALERGKGYFYNAIYLENGMDVGSGNIVIGSGNLALERGKGYFYGGMYLENGLDVGSGNLEVHGRNILDEIDWILENCCESKSMRGAESAEGGKSSPVTAKDSTILSAGQAQLSKGSAIIMFDEVFSKEADESKPVIVVVTPTSADCNGMAVMKTEINEVRKGQTFSGFYVAELNGGNSNATFNWQAVATRKSEK
ncbi:MAG: hypothetical protein NTX71_11975 [Candidatus Aureabacteria bacterium]|nr:hypothetical protein [Candidatus Auribacterota bacterium]